MEDNGKSYEIIVEEATNVTRLDEAKHLLKVVSEIMKELEVMRIEYEKASKILVDKIEGDLAIADALMKEELNEL